MIRLRHKRPLANSSRLATLASYSTQEYKAPREKNAYGALARYCERMARVYVDHKRYKLALAYADYACKLAVFACD